ncbi:hypothetical protein [Frankia nepalensis]|uniref:Uncharacterized protein n=1 Tax=Frankia nepalensis TaxID=1836974 RepID=A0A937URW3_9ACTN|nr:hypothetical protein [Frankia nepalensis]MBL7498661.1 hypothetical protein [Frankia nepalensis]MBL7509173.1 hypothetical protein [Frankia nepalensis]MBL7633254.1 hypothetical protein [Frankia nepalensis]
MAVAGTAQARGNPRGPALGGTSDTTTCPLLEEVSGSSGEDIYQISSSLLSRGAVLTIIFCDLEPKYDPRRVPTTGVEISLVTDDPRLDWNKAALGRVDPDSRGNFATSVTIPYTGNSGPLMPGDYLVHVASGAAIYMEAQVTITG